MLLTGRLLFNETTATVLTFIDFLAQMLEALVVIIAISSYANGASEKKKTKVLGSFFKIVS